MNLNTITRKILLAARALHIRSLDRTQNKAAKAYSDCIRASRMAKAAWAQALDAQDVAGERLDTVTVAVKAERRELGIDK